MTKVYCWGDFGTAIIWTREKTMHVEFLIEDLSGMKSLEILVPKIVGPIHTYRFHAYRGIGHIPKNINRDPDPGKRVLLNNLPRLLKGYGATFQSMPADVRPMLVVVCDLDQRTLGGFLKELKDLLADCEPKPDCHFCIAIEEGEAWFLGDLSAIVKAFPKAKRSILSAYVNDSIVGTWEVLANAVFPGGAKALHLKGGQAVGQEKSKWAVEICPYMNVDQNDSPSFRQFRDLLRSL